MAESNILRMATAPSYVAGKSDETLRNHALLALIKDRGRYKNRQTGYNRIWTVKMREPAARTMSEATVLQFTETDALTQFEVDVRAYVVTNRLTDRKRLLNTGPTAIIDLYDEAFQTMIPAMEKNLNAEVYVDGYAAANSTRLCGFGSWAGDDGNTTTADIIANPSDTYANKATGLGVDQGGTWSSDLATPPNATAAVDWPYGSGDTWYDYNSPILLNYNSTNWPGGVAGWEANCAALLRRARNFKFNLTGNTASKGYLQILGGQLYDQLGDFLETKEQVMAPHPKGLEMGLYDIQGYDGTMIVRDYHCDSNEGWGIDIDHMCLFSCHDQLYYMAGDDGRDYDINTLSTNFAICFYGNMQFDVKHQQKFADFVP